MFLCFAWISKFSSKNSQFLVLVMETRCVQCEAGPAAGYKQLIMHPITHPSLPIRRQTCTSDWSI